MVMYMPTCMSFFFSAWRADVSDWILLLRLAACCSKVSLGLHPDWQICRAADCQNQYNSQKFWRQGQPCTSPACEDNTDMLPVVFLCSLGSLSDSECLHEAVPLQVLSCFRRRALLRHTVCRWL